MDNCNDAHDVDDVDDNAPPYFGALHLTSIHNFHHSKRKPPELTDANKHVIVIDVWVCVHIASPPPITPCAKHSVRFCDLLCYSIVLCLVVTIHGHRHCFREHISCLSWHTQLKC
eukprot:m.95330 g.95330  ORF g.95330 m.95330 type:complete len:115 (+) comp8944_c2_seq4:1066-1410(+)